MKFLDCNTHEPTQYLLDSLKHRAGDDPVKLLEAQVWQIEWNGLATRLKGPASKVKRKRAARKAFRRRLCKLLDTVK